MTEIQAEVLPAAQGLFEDVLSTSLYAVCEFLRFIATRRMLVSCVVAAFSV